MTKDTSNAEVLTDAQIEKIVMASKLLRYHFALNGGAGPVSNKGKEIVRALYAHQPQPTVAPDVVPGQMRCAKCKFGLTRVNLNVNVGTATAGDTKTEPCPNGCGPLWPITWEQWARDGWDAAEQQALRAVDAEAALKELQSRLGPAATALPTGQAVPAGVALTDPECWDHGLPDSIDRAMAAEREELSGMLSAASNNILKGRASLEDSNVCIKAAELLANIAALTQAAQAGQEVDERASPWAWAVFDDGESDYRVYANSHEADDAALESDCPPVPLFPPALAPKPQVAAVPANPICGNCDTPFPPGCKGQFADDGDVCAAHVAAKAAAPEAGPRVITLKQGRNAGQHLASCAANREGDCNHRLCPQIKDGEPSTTGRHCPLDNQEDERL